MVSFEEIPEKKGGASSTAEEIPKKETDDAVDVDDSWEELMGKDLIMKVREVYILQYITSLDERSTLYSVNQALLYGYGYPLSFPLLCFDFISFCSAP